ncbi:MAG TPA: helix-turn-helix domain-containing protein [Roseiflexaceae bacterium]|nr:helix-turn-helix domain-containing protein [Roseiflexaceae bacterium]
MGAADVDEATPEAGRAELLARYRDVRKACIQAIAIYVENERGKHYGGHIFGFYRDFCRAEAITAHWRAALPTVKEIWPCNQVIRLLFGYHRWAATRGELWYLTDEGELLALRLDDPAELAEAFALVTSPLLLNDSPPPISVKPHSAPQPAPSAHKITLGERAAKHLGAQEAIVRFNQEHSLPDLLRQYGAEEVRPGYYSCPCGIAHTHRITLYISKRGKLFSHSPRCRWHTSKGWDSFGLYCLVEHGGDRVAALKTINPYPSRQHREQPPLPTMPEYLTPQAAEARCRDQERKRQDRRAQTAAVLAAARERLNDGSLSSRAAALLVVLLDLAGTSRQICPTNVALAERLGVSERTVQRAFRELQLVGVGKRHGGRFVPDNPSANTPAVWTFGQSEGDSSESEMVLERSGNASTQEREPSPGLAENHPGSVPAQKEGGALDVLRMTALQP